MNAFGKVEFAVPRGSYSFTRIGVRRPIAGWRLAVSGQRSVHLPLFVTRSVARVSFRRVRLPGMRWEAFFQDLAGLFS